MTFLRSTHFFLTNQLLRKPTQNHPLQYAYVSSCTSDAESSTTFPPALAAQSSLCRIVASYSKSPSASHYTITTQKKTHQVRNNLRVFIFFT